MIVDEIIIVPSDTPWEIACALINAEIERKSLVGKTCTEPFFEMSDLRRLGEHLINFCSVEREEPENE